MSSLALALHHLVESNDRDKLEHRFGLRRDKLHAKRSLYRAHEQDYKASEIHPHQMFVLQDPVRNRRTKLAELVPLVAQKRTRLRLLAFVHLPANGRRQMV